MRAARLQIVNYPLPLGWGLLGGIIVGERRMESGEKTPGGD